MKKYVLILFASFSLQMSGQTIQQIDSLSSKMCESFKTLKGVKDQTQILMVFQKHMPGFYKKIGVASKEQADSVSDRIYFRLQKNCQAFLDALGSLEENKSDWQKLSEKPKAKISKKQCDAFFAGKNFYYKEYDGKIVKVALSSTHWVETFHDNTTSTLLIRRKNNCEFDLEFLESNNNMRKNLSVKGDVYHYGVFSVENGVYDLWNVTRDNQYYSVRLYPQK